MRKFVGASVFLPLYLVVGLTLGAVGGCIAAWEDWKEQQWR